MTISVVEICFLARFFDTDKRYDRAYRIGSGIDAVGDQTVRTGYIAACDLADSQKDIYDDCDCAYFDQEYIISAF